MKINSAFILLNIFAEIQSLVELPVVEDNSIAITVIAIQNTLNNLFTYFKIQNVEHSIELKQYLTIHNLFVSIALRDCDSWNKIASLSTVNDIDNKAIYFITQINEVLNEGYNNNAVHNIDNNIYRWKLEYLKDWYTRKRKPNGFGNGDIPNIFKVTKLKYDAINNNSKTNDKSKYTIPNGEFWQPSGRRIYKGSRTNIKDFPFMASVQFFGKFQCAGSIIKSDLVITAASCLQLAWNNRFFRENPTYLTVQIGSHFYEHGGETVQIQEIYFYPKYDPKTLRHNLALMRLSRRIAFQTKSRRVKKIDIDRQEHPLFEFEKVTIVGWGAKDRSNVIYNVVQNKLSYAKLDFLPLEDCQDYYSKKYVTRNNFCAGFLTKGAGACNRDVGGPGVIDGMLVGVISFASPVCGAPGPTVFTKLGYYANWIDDIMEQDVPRIAAATTKLLPKIYYNDLNTERTAPPSFTPFGDTTAPWEEAVTIIKNKDDLRTVANKKYDDNGQKQPINNYQHLDITSELQPETTISGYIEGATRMGDDLLPSTVMDSASYQNKKQGKSKTKNKKQKSKPNVTTTVRHSRKIVKRKKVKYTTTLATPLEDEITTEPLLSKAEQEDAIEKALVEIINNLDIDHIVKSIEPALDAKLSSELKRKNKKKQLKERKTTKGHNALGTTQMQRFLL